MSISAPLAVTMMIGTWLRLRSCRHTSMPDTWGSITSSRTRSGLTASNRSRAWAPSRATWTRKPSRRRPDGQGVDEGLLVLHDQHGGLLGHVTLPRAIVGGETGDRAGQRDAQRERRALALDRTPPRPAAVVGGHVAHDGEARARCRRSRGCGPGRPGRSARRCGRGRAAGMPMPWSRTAMSTTCRRRRATSTSTAAPGSEYLTRVLDEVGRPPTRAGGGRRGRSTRRDGSTTSTGMPRCGGQRRGTRRRPRRRRRPTVDHLGRATGRRARSATARAGPR